MTTTYVSIRKQIIENNRKANRNDPPFEIRTDKNDLAPQRAHQAEFTGTIRLIYDAQQPLASGAVCWVEIDSHELQSAHPIEPPRRRVPAPKGRVINVGVTESAPAKDGYDGVD